MVSISILNKLKCIYIIFLKFNNFLFIKICIYIIHIINIYTYICIYIYYKYKYIYIYIYNKLIKLYIMKDKTNWK